MNKKSSKDKLETRFNYIVKKSNILMKKWTRRVRFVLAPFFLIYWRANKVYCEPNWTFNSNGITIIINSFPCKHHSFFHPNAEIGKRKELTKSEIESFLDEKENQINVLFQDVCNVLTKEYKLNLEQIRKFWVRRIATEKWINLENKYTLI